MSEQRFWHPFADMRAVVEGGELVIDRGEGAHVFDTAGRRYVDATASLWYCNVGHGRREIADAAAEQMRRLEAYSTFGDVANPPVLDLAEPVIGAGGVFHAPPGYLSKVRDICREAGVLFVADEVVTGFGRVGSWFASERFALDPDLIVCAKGITSGYLPLGAVIAAGRVAEPFFDGTVGMWRHGYTYSGHATVAAAALANLDIIEREGLLERSRSLELELAAALRPLESHDLVTEVRVAEGVLAAVQIDPAAIAEDASLPTRAVAAARSAGVMTRSLATGAIHVSPPLVITSDELGELADGLRKALDEVSEAA